MAKLEVDLDALTEQLGKTTIPKESGVSFAGESLKLETAEDAKKIVDAIIACDNLEYLNLEGNSLGVVAAEHIAKALSTHGELKRAIWKDMFTGRLKTEIPEALRFLGRGLITAKANLEVLDLSDNASGPIGVEGFKELLMSPVCYSLKELRLNNMGLGITGGKMLAVALEECYKKSLVAGTPLALQVFVAGRNRLENKGAIALGQVFSMLGSLETVSMPQNGIYQEGVMALSPAFIQNKGLLHINLNDNTVGVKGAAELSNALSSLHNLTTLDLGDCLLKSKGAKHVAMGLKYGSKKLEEVNLSFNEINTVGGLALVEALAEKPLLKVFSLNGNLFGVQGVSQVISGMSKIGKANVLSSFSEDEGDGDSSEDEEVSSEDDGEDEVEEEEDEDEDDDEIGEEEENNEDSESDSDNMYVSSGVSPMLRMQAPQGQVNGEEFLKCPTGENLLKLENNKVESIVKAVKDMPEPFQLDHLIVAIMRVSSLTVGTTPEVQNTALPCSEKLYKELFIWGQSKGRNCMSHINNTLPVCLGLIKNEDHNDMKKKYNLEGCLFAARNAINKGIIPMDTRTIIEIFLAQPK